MDRLLASLLMVFFFIAAEAADPSESAIQSQENDQSLCAEQRANQCINTCETIDDTDCVATCKQTAKNECRQAGE